MATPIATSAIRTNRTNVVGCGLKLKSRIARERLGMTPEAEFEIWASRKQACGATGINDFYAIRQLALTSWLLSGDAFVLFRFFIIWQILRLETNRSRLSNSALIFLLPYTFRLLLNISSISSSSAVSYGIPLVP